MRGIISPSKQFSLLSPRSVTSPFKKFPSKQKVHEQQLRTVSPFRYVNTKQNPEIKKNLALSGHHLNVYCKDNFISSHSESNPMYKSSVFRPISKINNEFKQGVFHQFQPKTHKNLNVQTNIQQNRSRRLSHTEISGGPYSSKIDHRKHQVRQHKQSADFLEVPQMRDRKHSHQEGSSNYKKQPIQEKDLSENKNQQFHFVQHFHHNKNSPFLQFSQHFHHNRNQPLSFSQHYQPKQLDHFNAPHLGKLSIDQPPTVPKLKLQNFYSLTQISDDSNPFPFPTLSKFRKQSDVQCELSKENKVHVPSFLLKKSQKRNEISKSPQKYSPSPNKVQKQLTNSQSHKKSTQHKVNLKDFIVLKKLGQGKVGKVLLVRQKFTGFICAMKVVKKSHLTTSNSIDQFIREMKIQMYLNNPNVIKMYGYFDDLSSIYILIEVACDGSLYQFLETFHHQGRMQRSYISMTQSGHQHQSPTGLTLKQTAGIMYQVCSGVNYLHSKHIIHRDLKPQNIVMHEKTIKLCDFGWSVFKGSQMRTTFCGTPLYLCPQLITGEEYDQKVDIWAIGIMLYEYLIGPNPFDIKKEADLANVVLNDLNLNERDISVIESLDPTAKDLIRGCLNKDPVQRLDIKDILEHEFFKKYCPELMNSNNGMTARNNNF